MVCSFSRGVIFHLIFFFSAVCSFSEKTVSLQKPVTIVVFVHGTILSLPSFNSFYHTISDQTAGHLSFWDRYRLSLRHHSFNMYQPIQALGLQPVRFKEQADSIPSTLSTAYESMYRQVYGHDEKLAFYTFGWNAKLDNLERAKAADQLYWLLTKKIARFKRRGYSVKMHLLGHSHGGNVCLYLAHNEKVYQKKLSVERLILLGTPVQKETKNFVYDEIFDRVYNISSPGDFVQRLDVFSTKGGYSRATFDKKRQRATATKLVEISVSVNDWNPNHAELWFYADDSVIKYRNRFPLYPFPVASLVPHLMAVADRSPEQWSSACARVTIDKGRGAIELRATTAQLDGVQLKGALERLQFTLVSCARRDVLQKSALLT